MSVTVQQLWDTLSEDEQQGFTLAMHGGVVAILDTNNDPIVWTRSDEAVSFRLERGTTWTSKPDVALNRLQEALYDARSRIKMRATDFAIEKALREEGLARVKGAKLLGPTRVVIKVDSVEHARALVVALRGMKC
jgi:hypothetical protein